MKAIETLLKLDTGCKFATPKKLNRSSKLISDETINSLENGEFTTEMINELTGKYPIFRYRTCITIHGNWAEVNRTRIGGYKNVHQNQNGSVEIYYSAIDRDKIQTIREEIKGVNSPFHYTESSTSRNFLMVKKITKENFQQVREEMEPIGKQLAALNIYGHINLYTAQDFFANYLVLSLTPLAIPQEEVSNLILTLSQCTEQEHNERREKFIAEKVAEEKERKQQYEELKQRQATKEAAAKEQIEKVYKPQIAGLKESRDLNAGILIGITNGASPQINFVFYRKDGNGSFGRVKYSKALSPTLSGELHWKEQKQAMPADILRKSNTYYLLQSNKPEPRRTPIIQYTPNKILATINY